MAKLLIAVKSEDLGKALAEGLPHCRVHICHTGADALTALEALRPDIFLVELSLPVLTGLSVLQKTSYRPPAILALTNLITESILRSAADAGVQDVIRHPCSVGYIIDRLDALAQKISTPEG